MDKFEKDPFFNPILKAFEPVSVVVMAGIFYGIYYFVRYAAFPYLDAIVKQLP